MGQLDKAYAASGRAHLELVFSVYGLRQGGEVDVEVFLERVALTA